MSKKCKQSADNVFEEKCDQKYKLRLYIKKKVEIFL